MKMNSRQRTDYRIAVTGSLLGMLQLFTASPALAESGPLGFGSSIFDEDLQSDRPDITEGTSAISPGHLQIEGGYTFTRERSGQRDEKSHSLPELLTRFGLLTDLELRLGLPTYEHTEDDSSDLSQEGLSDSSIGIKHEMYEESIKNPAVSVILETSLPTGSSELSADALEPAFKLLWSYSILESFGIAGNFNFSFPVEDETRYFVQGTTLAGSYSSGVFGYYMEYYGEFPSAEAPDSSAAHLLNGGLTYAVTDDFQLDARVGFGLNDEAPDLLAGSGFAIRF